jgi:hypothetical protein
MTEYIITEELWNRILHTLWDCQEVNLCVRIREESRPYQNQREKIEEPSCHTCQYYGYSKCPYYPNEPEVEVCISQSDFQNQREKLLDELEKWVKQHYFYWDGNWCDSGLLEKIKELRGGQ